MSTRAAAAGQPREGAPEDVVREHERACDETPRHYREWLRAHEADVLLRTRPQQAFIGHADQVALFWGGVRTGKSTTLAQDCALFYRGDHPRQTHRAPTIQLHAGRSWVQMVDQLRTLWRFLDPRWFRARLDLSEGSVRGQRFPVLTGIAGPGRDSQIRIGTYEMGALSVQGWTIHRAQLDEPPPQAMYTEVRSRVISTGGRVRIGFCPTSAHMGPKGTDLDYIWKLVDSGEVGLVHAPLTVESVTPCEGLILAPYMTREAIDSFSREIPARDRAMRLGLSRYPHQEGQFFDAWSNELVVSLGVPAGWSLGVGVDHGSKPGRQRASLVAVRGTGATARVHVLRHYRSAGRSDDDADAAGILAMLAETGHELSDVDYWIGDRAHGGDRKGGIKSNYRLMRALARAVGIDDTRKDWRSRLPAPLRRMWTPTKYDGSVWDDVEVLHRLMVRKAFTVDPSAGGDDSLGGDFAAWNGQYIDPHKDGIDSCRYAAVPMIAEGWRRAA